MSRLSPARSCPGLWRMPQLRTKSRRPSRRLVLESLEDRVVPSGGCVPPPPGLVSWWPGDDNAADFVGHNDGTLVNGATFAPGKVDGAFSFDGVDDFVDLGNPASLNITNAITLESWINTNDLAEGQIAAVISKWGQSVALDSYDVSIRKDAGVINLIGAIGEGATPEPGLIGGAISPNTWTHIAMTYDGATGQNVIYINGVPVASRIKPGGIFTSDVAVALGREPNDIRPRFFTGFIDEPAIYSRALTQSEIQAIFNAGSAGKCKPDCVPPPPGLVAWLPGNGNTDDVIGNHDGTLVNGATFGPGKVHQAFSFDGASWVDVPDDPVWTLGTNDFTMDLWVNANHLSGRDPFIAHDDGGGEQNKWIFWYDAQGHDKLHGTPALRFHINSPHPDPVPAPHDAVVAPWSPVLGQWYHVAVTRSGINYALYIDGAQVATDTSTFTIPDPNVPLTIGRAEGFALDGSIDEVDIFNRALSASEIAGIYNAGSAGKCQFQTVQIDIKPGTFPNAVNLASNGVLPVAVLTTPDFDATSVDTSDLSTIRFGDVRFAEPARVSPVRSVLADVDGDGDTDLLFHFSVPEIRSAGALVPDSTEAVLTARASDGHPIRGTDSVQIVHALRAARPGPGRTTGRIITPALLNPLLSEALARWTAAGFDTASLGPIQVQVTNLGGRTLGLASGHTITLDDNAAGWGWFVDKSPWEDSEFSKKGDPLILPSPPRGRGSIGDRMDLLTVLEHEVGHLLGFDHSEAGALATGVMNETLMAGVRLMPQSGHSVLDQLFKADLVGPRRHRKW